MRFRRHIFEVQNTKESVDMYEEMERLGREYEAFPARCRRSMHFCTVSCECAGCLQNITTEIAQSVELDTQDVTRGLDLDDRRNDSRSCGRHCRQEVKHV